MKMFLSVFFVLTSLSCLANTNLSCSDSESDTSISITYNPKLQTSTLSFQGGDSESKKTFELNKNLISVKDIRQKIVIKQMIALVDEGKDIESSGIFQEYGLIVVDQGGKSATLALDGDVYIFDCTLPSK